MGSSRLHIVEMSSLLAKVVDSLEADECWNETVRLVVLEARFPLHSEIAVFCEKYRS
jgi:hypothetical protein